MILFPEITLESNGASQWIYTHAHDYYLGLLMNKYICIIFYFHCSYLGLQYKISEANVQNWSFELHVVY